jgi:hypothetical protein
MTYMIKQQTLVTIAAVSALVLMPGCSEKSERMMRSGADSSAQDAYDDGSRVIATVNGKPVVTQQRLDRAKEMVIAAQPQLRQVLAMMPQDQINRQLTDQLVSQALMAEYVKENGIDQTPQYKAALEEMKQGLAAKFFVDSLPIAPVSDAAVREFYDQNKTVMPGLMVSQGESVVQGISFPQEAQAQAFLAKAVASGFDAAAKDMSLADKVQDLARSAGIAVQVQEKIMALKKAPGIELVKVDADNVWVLCVLNKTEPEYVDFDKVKGEIRTYIENQERGKILYQEMDRLKKQYAVEVDESFFGASPDDQEPAEMIESDELNDESQSAQSPAKPTTAAA